MQTGDIVRIRDFGAVAWRDPPAGKNGPGDGEAELVLAPLWAPAAVMPALHSLLAPAERAVADRHGRADGRDRAIVSRGVLRLVLSRHAGLSPEALDIAIAPDGKPYLRDPDAGGRPLTFNLSHTDDLLLCAVARSPVGVDLEAIGPTPDADGFARIALGPRESAAHLALPAERRLEHACRIWVCKEALAKRSGEGIRRDFADFDLDDTPGADSDVIVFTPQAGHIAAVATSPGVTALRFRRILRIDDFLRESRHFRTRE